MTPHHTFRAPGEGPNYDWANDHTFVKVSAGETGGAYTLMEDNLKATFALGLHVHHTHAETFYILIGSVDFFIDDTWFSAPAGSTLHVPPGVPHACAITP
ncbi:MAG: cupin domain-containing protein, partial [Pseudomonadota bacterium]